MAHNRTVKGETYYFETVLQISIQHSSMDEAPATFPIKIKKEKPLSQQGVKFKNCPRIGLGMMMKKGERVYLTVFHNQYILFYIQTELNQDCLCWEQFHRTIHTKTAKLRARRPYMFQADFLSHFWHCGPLGNLCSWPRKEYTCLQTQTFTYCWEYSSPEVQGWDSLPEAFKQALAYTEGNFVYALYTVHHSSYHSSSSHFLLKYGLKNLEILYFSLVHSGQYEDIYTFHILSLNTL